MTATDQTPPFADERIAASVERAIDRLYAEQDRERGWWDRADFASQTALAFLQMRPPADAGERAAGIAEGLEMAVRALLHLAGVDTPDNTQEDPCV